VTQDDSGAAHFAAGVNIAGELATARLVALLREAGVDTIVLKGPLTTRWLRPEATARYSNDVDLLARPHKATHAAAALQGAGYELLPSEAGDEKHASTWIRDGSFSVDLHRTLVGVRVPDEKAWSVLSSSVDAIDVAGVPCAVLGRAASALSIALHAAQHGPHDSRVLDDLALALERLDSSGWREAARLAHGLNATHAFATGLRLREEGQKVAAALELPETTTTETALRSAGAPPTALGFERLAQAGSTRRRASMVIRELVPSPAFMRTWHPLAAKGPAGLLVAYMMRPFWLLRWALPGLSAWLKARRRARAS
jgi:hypothetical protein